MEEIFREKALATLGRGRGTLASFLLFKQYHSNNPILLAIYIVVTFKSAQNAHTGMHRLLLIHIKPSVNANFIMPYVFYLQEQCLSVMFCKIVVIG